jgi:hemerythrin-like domain-containing protein
MNSTPIETLKDYCHWFWKNHVSQHFHQEEHILLKFIPADDKMAIQLKEEHNGIRELILSIGHKPDAITISMLADFVCRHIRFEERILFTHLEKTLSSEQLDCILQQLELEPVCSTEWKDEFWQRQPTRINNTES